MTLAALSVNEDTFLVSDDAILADLCAESSRVDFVADGRPKETSLLRQPTTAPFRDRCDTARPAESTVQEDDPASDKASDIWYVSKRESDTHLAMLELQERVVELTCALQQERRSHAEDIAQLQVTNLQAVEEVKKMKAQVDQSEKARRHQEAEAELVKQAEVSGLQRTAGRALVGGAVAGYEGLLKAVAVELDVVKGEREMCLLLLRNLQLYSSALV
jgi:hypothetical protein